MGESEGKAKIQLNHIPKKRYPTEICCGKVMHIPGGCSFDPNELLTLKSLILLYIVDFTTFNCGIKFVTYQFIEINQTHY